MKTYRSLTHLYNVDSITTKLLLLPNIVSFLQIEYYVTLHMTIEKGKTIYRVHKLVFDKGDRSLECFNRVIQNYELWQKNMMKKYFVSVKKNIKFSY